MISARRAREADLDNVCIPFVWPERDDFGHRAPACCLSMIFEETGLCPSGLGPPNFGPPSPRRGQVVPDYALIIPKSGPASYRRSRAHSSAEARPSTGATDFAPERLDATDPA